MPHPCPSHTPPTPFSHIASKINYPLSVKLRLQDSVSHTVDIVRRLHSVGVSAFTIHGSYTHNNGGS